MSDEDWRTVIDTNLGGVFATCRAAARGMMKRRSGAIVNLSSVVGVHGNPGQTNYAASKAGIIGFTKALARELATRNVRANAIAPGYIETGSDRGAARTPFARRCSPRRRSAGSACRLTWQARYASSAPTRPRSSRAKCSSSTAAWECRGASMETNGSLNGRRRVVITGLGALTPLGNDVETTWTNLISGRSGAGPITQFDATGLSRSRSPAR